MDELTVNITENLEAIEVNITEGSITTIYPTPSTYKIDFTTDTTDIWAIYSKFNGNITSVTLDNVTSYTIDGVVVTLPFEVELNTVYLIEIVKTNPNLTASITFNTSYISFDEVLNMPDFSIGTGQYIYLLGNTTANTTLLKYDADLFNRSNWTGSTWTVNPLNATITLPTLPTNGIWSRVLYVKDDYMLVSGGNTGNYEKYFCKIDLITDAVTDLDGITGYSTKTGAYNGYPKTQIYDYVNNVVYFAYYGGNTISKLSDISYLNLNTNELFNDKQFSLTGGWNEQRKVNFDPYQGTFFVKNWVYSINSNAKYDYEYAYKYETRKLFNNPYTNKFYHTIQNDTRYFAQFNHKGKFEFYEMAGDRAGFVISYDKKHNHFVHNLCLVYSTSRHTFRKYGVQSGAYSPIYDTPTELYCLDAMYAKNYIHASIYDDFKRLHLYDMDVDLSTTSAEFGYLDLPVECWSLYTNRLL